MKLEMMLDDVRDDPERFLVDWGMELGDYIDEDALIREVIDTDGLGAVASYDGDVLETRVQDREISLNVPDIINNIK